MKYLLCLVGLLGWATLAASGTITCVTKPPSAVIGVSEAAISRALTLIVEKDKVALQMLIDRGQVVMAKPGTELRAENASDFVVRVRLPGSPDTLYTYRDYLDCHQ
jgi:hypothetical protein